MRLRAITYSVDCVSIFVFRLSQDLQLSVGISVSRFLFIVMSPETEGLPNTFCNMKTDVYLPIVLLAVIMTLVSCSSYPEFPDSYESTRPTKPTAKFSYQTAQPLKVIFTNQSSYDGTCYWDFGDGTTSTKQNPTHRYNGKGVYKVQLTVHNLGQTAKDSYQTNITILPPTKLYINGYTMEKINHNNEYYSVKVIDDDFFTTTWFTTTWVLLSNANLPYNYTFKTPVLMDGLANDEWYRMDIYYNNKTTGNGTKISAYKIPTAQLMKYPESYTGDDGNTRCTLHFTWK